MAEPALRVAFTNIPSRLWAGGHNYQRNLFEVLNRYRPGAIAPVLFAGAKDDAAEVAAYARIPGVQVVQSPVFDRAGSKLFSALTLGLDKPAIALFRDCNIDMVFESARFFGWRLPLPAIAWFPDFQHRLLPHLFSNAAYWRREFGFRVQIASGRHIMLSSASALGDLRKFYPAMTKGVSVVRFATAPPSDLLSADPVDVILQYDLPQPYFYLPNQFWRHKNHELVVDALDLVKRRGLDIVVAASGSTYDPREPDYFESVMRQVKDRGLVSNFRHLGMIPLNHVYSLLRASAALINPSRCEGWSTTVEEAKAFGVPMLLSDLDVHREQTGGAAQYFGVDDAQALADHILNVAQSARALVVRELQPDLEDRVCAFVADFVGLATDVMRGARTR
ncbi:glycosyltransferase family 4 protein [Bradyrhizobium canariense]|uniref:Glycosyl transferase n=1 Tax=Bradyrhizobium canariense TaxID=255045 RepID=A0A1X3H495_9BRAD|nr:glycosyltransferase family 1 protein [Bradyrhizobium canariense]OSI69468.1 glycosyl transferase [Bradyrhizobium canariense]OSI78273.1 glycosyl transferase [Bradyrhizobium canariense]OSI90224.1 glycosyl transferase [Bradyrhizobium canariense]OSI93573.1 glycosyl transferase [Bradyrhizobium canariense]OSJ03549.1 glycosyl transferase [Bradyrhizobium canariense]